MKSVGEWIEEIPYLQEAENMEAFVEAIRKEQRLAIAEELRDLADSIEQSDEPQAGLIARGAWRAADIAENAGKGAK